MCHQARWGLLVMAQWRQCNVEATVKDTTDDCLLGWLTNSNYWCAASMACMAAQILIQSR
jgi:hypothetical protein